MLGYSWCPSWACDLLRPVFEHFMKGLATVDLNSAKGLVATLPPPRACQRSRLHLRLLRDLSPQPKRAPIPGRVFFGRRNPGVGRGSEGGTNNVRQPQPTNENRRLPASPPRGGRRPASVRRSRRLQSRTVAAAPGHWRAEVDRHVQRAECVLCRGWLCAAERPGCATGDERRRRAQRHQRCGRLLQRARPGHLHRRINTAQVRRTRPGGMHHTMADGSYDHFLDAYAHVTAAHARLTPRNAAAEIDRLILTAWREKLPVYMELPSDIACLDIETPADPLMLADTPSDPERLRSCVAAITARLSAAKSPAILVDADADRFGVTSELMELAEKMHAPV